MAFLPTPPSASKPGSFPPETTPAIPIAPPPWILRAKAWIFLYTDIDNHNPPPQNPNNAEDILQSILAPGAYHPFETIHPSALQRLPNGEPQFQPSWLKGVMIVRYDDSDVGPYDELIFIPGRAVNPHSGKKDMRISTIYVSTDSSVWNGRRNWNIPKHRARFEFTPTSSGKDTALRVYHPEDIPAPFNPKTPFFSAFLKESWLPKLPLPSLAPFSLVQPPLSKSRYPPGVQDATIATDDPENGRENPWLLCRPSFKGSWGLAYADTLPDGEVTLQQHGDGIGFPEVKLWSVGTAFDGIVGFGVSDIAS
ncbi:hypothetical protein ASPSYDRAFT_476216 [Aspergillus sydowii CBS 593.65]|uniref:Uncharacterized protein n=1 Tax=Aspergillus sydowii CBS 593.65 TaxID=1036612 RepID=A0A1L9T5V7_9EURO|nr:uncharacterized protein ASPSYDRAFT_476216 [Aspergillus sydowii CBS 593.65]OJJ54787.1 hypothetical protein ASPSYDRAFT_476216 [Aspergillus sydowii CBS 593.65]